MLARQRQMLIVEQVRRDGAVRVSDLVEALAVSDMTIRRDLDVLAEQGLVEKVHGGATLPSARRLEEPGFEAKSA
ncbi:MAG: DeoR family transcriptional regulator, partial [Micromonosporaceae bacterium]